MSRVDQLTRLASSHPHTQTSPHKFSENDGRQRIYDGAEWENDIFQNVDVILEFCISSHVRHSSYLTKKKVIPANMNNSNREGSNNSNSNSNSSSSKKRKLHLSAQASDDHDESDLLASLGSTLHNMDQYEQDVLRTAQLEQTPRLTGFGFPSLLQLAPSGRALSDLPHFQTVLANVRQQLTQQPHNLKLLLQQQMLLNAIHTASNDFEQCLRPQEELKQEQVRRQRFQRQRQRQQEESVSQPALRPKKRKIEEKIQRRTPQKSSLKPTAPTFQEEDNEIVAINRLEQIKKQTKSVSFAEPPRRRIGIQKRRRSNNDDHADEETEEELQQRKEQLKKLRQEREKRQRKRRQKWFTSSNRKPTSIENNNGDEEETELDFVDNGEEVLAQPKLLSISDDRPDDDEINDKESTTLRITKEDLCAPIDVKASTTSLPVQTSCPLCQEAIEAPDQASLDEELSKHMGECQTSRHRTRGQRQSSRQAAAKVKSYAEFDESEEEDEKPTTSQSQTTGRKRPGHRTGPTEDPSDKGYEAVDREEEEEELLVDTMHDTSCVDDDRSTNHGLATDDARHRIKLDDFEEDDYEDRVDDWIENGISNMRVMKERDEEEQPPGEEIYDGGLVIPAWINDRLFPYQRTGLQWMWELHQQQAGGIVGGELEEIGTILF